MRRWEPIVRPGLTLLVLIAQALLIDLRFRWARPQNGGPDATLHEMLVYPSFSLISCVLAYIGVGYRLWSWLFLFSCACLTYWIFDRLLSDVGLAFTRALYEDTLLRVAFNCAVFGGALILHQALRWRSNGLPTSKIALGLLMIPAWCAALLFLR